MTSILGEKPQKRLAIFVLKREYGSSNYIALVELEVHLLRAIESCSTELVIDMSETSNIGCGFINVLLRCHRRALECHISLRLCSLNPFPESVLDITGLNALWRVFRTSDEAMEAMESKKDTQSQTKVRS